MAESERPLIITGYDGSDQSRDGLGLARVLAGLLEADVVALSVLTLAPTETTWAAYEQVAREEGERLAAEARAGLRGVAGLEVVTQPGASPARELHEMAERRGARMLVVGSTHRRRLGRVLPGTVADRLLAGAPCPLAVAPRGYAPGERQPQTIAVA